MFRGKKISIFLLTVGLLFSLTNSEKTESCDLENEFCYPLDDLSFAEKFKQFTTNKKLEAASERVSSSSFLKKVYPKMKYTGRVSLFAKEKINKNETIFNIPVSSTLQEKIIFDSFTPDADNTFSSVHKILRKIDFKHDKDDLLTPTELKTIHTLLYHIYHVEHSPFKNDIINFPLENKMILLRMNPEEIQFINDLRLRDGVTNLKKSIKQSYFFYRQRVNLVWNVADCISFFERDYVPFQDFAYAFYILRASFQMFSPENEEQPTFMFIPAYSLFINSEKTDDDAIFPLVFKKNPETPKNFENGNIEFRAVKEFKKDDEIFTYYNFEDSLKIYLKYGVVMVDNHFDCTTIRIADDYYSSLLNIANHTCFGIGHVKSLYAFGNMANMDGYEMAECKKKIARKSQELMPDVIIEECSHPLWKNIDFFNISRTNLQKEKNELEITIRTLEEMYTYLTKEGKESDIVENIIKIYKNKEKGINSIFDEMNKYMNINKEKFQRNEDNDDLDDLEEKSDL